MTAKTNEWMVLKIQLNYVWGDPEGNMRVEKSREHTLRRDAKKEQVDQVCKLVNADLHAFTGKETA